jgi:hypothetical protein
VARDGIEPPTPAFSGLDAAIVNPLILLTIALNYSPPVGVLLEREWNVIRNVPISSPSLKR